jgi:hypothetical protein
MLEIFCRRILTISGQKSLTQLSLPHLDLLGYAVLLSRRMDPYPNVPPFCDDQAPNE